MATQATVNSRVTTAQGNKRVVLANLTWDNTYEFDTGLHIIDSMQFHPTTNASCGLTKVRGVITLVSAGALTGELRAEGA